ncbi:PIN domain protein [Caulifigura coniformis]|uniref:PIN domain protein n=1 Tax=Caulifigura coniformis TaxID=2527983 RepID=A0A517SA68_9PLAN|nr:type II toxin-antitoxin system VapC family toxin [Caulifigura coniformis]QDT53021.1 PIN domain protein [Caulifigura coniformis]
MANVVLDASALLAAFLDEPGSDLVKPVLYGATMSAVNYSEVFTKLIERGADIITAHQFLERQYLTVVPFDRTRATAAASLLPHTSPHGLSFADRACLATGVEFAAEILTAEQRMALTPVGANVTLIRSRQAAKDDAA